MNLKSLSIAALLPLAVSCGGNGGSGSQQTTANVSAPSAQTIVKHFSMNVSSPSNEQEGHCGDNFTIAISSDGAMRVDKITLKVDGKDIATLPAGDSIYQLSTAGLRCGTVPVVAQIQSGDATEYVSKSIRLFSDITPTIKTYKILEQYPHDANAYTQGLVLEGDVMYESTGLRGQSSIRKVNFRKGDVIKSQPLDNRYFGEGLAMVGDKLYQLTWQSRRAFAYDKNTFQQIGEYQMSTEGWGLTALSADTLLLTDGTENLYFVDPNSFAVLKTIQVYDNVGPVERLNETELYNGHLLANIYQTDMIAEIDINTGKVINMINLEGILPDNLMSYNTDVLNGIAYDQAHDRLYVTGKNWPKMYLIKIIDTK